MANYYVTQREGTDGWNVVRENSDRASANVNTQAEAGQLAKEYARNSGGGEVRIQGRDGRFRDSDTVGRGNDPFPPRDKKH